MVRKAVRKEVQAEVLAACRRRCAICYGLKGDTRIERGQIAHLDRDAANPSFDNLVFLCLKHHDQFDSTTSQSKRLTSDEVRRFREELTTAIGTGAHFGAQHHRPAPEIASDRTILTVAHQRPTIREKSAAEILGHLKGLTPSYRFYEKVKELYVGRWTREPGWQATVYELPSKLSGRRWYCAFKEIGSGTLVSAMTAQDVSTLRPGDGVTVAGRISNVSQLDSIMLEDAVVRSDDVPFPPRQPPQSAPRGDSQP